MVESAEVAPKFAPGPNLEVDEGCITLPPAADMPPTGGLFGSPLMLDSIKFLTRWFLRDSMLNEFVTSSKSVSVSKSV